MQLNPAHREDIYLNQQSPFKFTERILPDMTSRPFKQEGLWGNNKNHHHLEKESNELLIAEISSLSNDDSYFISATAPKTLSLRRNHRRTSRLDPCTISREKRPSKLVKWHEMRPRLWLNISKSLHAIHTSPRYRKDSENAFDSTSNLNFTDGRRSSVSTTSSEILIGRENSISIFSSLEEHE